MQMTKVAGLRQRSNEHQTIERIRIQNDGNVIFVALTESVSDFQYISWLL